MTMPELSVIIVSYNTSELLRRCLDHLYDAAGDIELEVIVVDNNSTDGSLAMLANDPFVARIIANETNVGFAAANNQGLVHASANIALLLNSDAFITRDAITAAIDLLQSRPNVGVVGVRLDNPDGTLQATYGSFPALWDDICSSTGVDQIRWFHLRSIVHSGPVDWVQGACMFVRVSALDQVGLLDTRFHMYSEEVDWCYRFNASGWLVWYLGGVGIVHLGGASSSNFDLRRRVALYQSRLGLRRRLGGPISSVCLWLVILLGLSVRIVGRSTFQLLSGSRLGQQTPRSDWQLFRAVLLMDPLARWAAR